MIYNTWRGRNRWQLQPWARAEGLRSVWRGIKSTWGEQAHLLQSKMGIPGQPHSCRTSARTQAQGSAASNLLKNIINNIHSNNNNNKRQKPNGKAELESSRVPEAMCQVCGTSEAQRVFLIPALFPGLAVSQIHVCKSETDPWPAFNLPESRTHTI